MRHRLFVLFIGVAVFGSLPMAVRAQSTTPLDTTQPILLRYKFKVGDVQNYQSSQETVMVTTVGTVIPPHRRQRHSNITLRAEVLKVRDSDGAATILVSAEIVETKTVRKLEVEVTKLPSGKAVSLNIHPSGTANMPTSAESALRSNQLSAILPDHPVKVGDDWETEGELFALPLKIKTTLIDIKVVGMETVADLKSLITADGTMILPNSKAPIPMKANLTGMQLMEFNVTEGGSTSVKLVLHTTGTMVIPRTLLTHKGPEPKLKQAVLPPVHLDMTETQEIHPIPTPVNTP